jgi:16S rRNA (guanine527-N7)-methyltransferase
VTGEEAVDVHVADSLSALALPGLRAARRVADIGSGAGFPGLVLAIALPEARIALVESVGRKCDYLRRVTELAGLDNVEVICARAESWPQGLGVHDAVLARAVAELPVLCEYAAPLLAPGGELIAWKGNAAPAESLAGDRAAELLGLEAGRAIRSAPYPGSVGHHLHVYRKRSPTPAGFPRRPGMARKRPLGAV